MHDGVIGGMDVNPTMQPGYMQHAGEMALANRFLLFPDRVGVMAVPYIYTNELDFFGCAFPYLYHVRWWWCMGSVQWARWSDRTIVHTSAR